MQRVTKINATSASNLNSNSTCFEKEQLYKHTNIITILKAEYKGDYKLLLVFNNGAQGIVNLEDKLEGEVFEPLKNKDVFKNFQLDGWTVTWNNEIDFAPEYLYKLCIEHN